MKKLVKKDGYMIVYEMINGWSLKYKEVERVPLEEWYRRYPEQRPGYTPPGEKTLNSTNNE